MINAPTLFSQTRVTLNSLLLKMTVLFSPPNITSAVILCGPGTRLGPLVDGVPKALLPVAGVPAVQRVLDWLLAGTEVESGLIGAN